MTGIFQLTESAALREKNAAASGELTTWDVKIRKMYIFTEKLPDIVSLNSWIRDRGPSQHLVSFKEVKLTPLFFHAVSDASAMASWGDPREYVRLKRGISEEDARKVIRELLKAVHHIHERGVAHGHIRWENVRQHQPSGRVVILEHILPITAVIPRTALSNSMFRLAAPEIRRYEPFSYPADVWAVGTILQQLLQHHDREYEGEDFEDTDLLSPHVNGLNGLAVGFLMGCLKSDPSERHPLDELMSHPFITKDSISTGILDIASGEDEESDEESPESRSEKSDGEVESDGDSSSVAEEAEEREG